MVKHKDILVKLSVCLFIYSACFLINRQQLYKKDFYGPYYDSMLEEIILPLSNYLGQNFYIRDFILQFGALTLDTTFAVFGILCAYYGRGWKEIMAFGLFYGYRAFFLNLFDFTIPEGVLSENPGFFSFMTPFGRASDFFYSGHTGCAFLGTLFIDEYGHKKLFKIGLFITLTQGIVMMVTRVHFFIDIIFGFCFAHFFKMISHTVGMKMNRILPFFGKVKY